MFKCKKNRFADLTDEILPIGYISVSYDGLRAVVQFNCKQQLPRVL